MRRLKRWYNSVRRAARRVVPEVVEMGGLGLGAWTLWTQLDPLAGGLFGAAALVFLSWNWSNSE